MKSFKLAFVMALSSLFLSGCLPGLSASPQSSPTPTPSAPSQPTSQYQSYSPEAVAAATSQRRVLFFQAAWDPTCQKLDQEITKRLSELPDQVVIFKTDYDTQTELKKKLGVTYQHTVVELDATDKVLKKWSVADFDELLAGL